MYCNSCGIKLADHSLFCFQCGAQQKNRQISSDKHSEDLAARRLRQGISFLDNWLAFLAVGVLATITTVLFLVGLQGSSTWTMANLMQQFCMVGSLAMAALASTRVGGLDVSVGGMMALSSVLFAMNSMEQNAVGGFLLALLVCGAVGLLNGLFIIVMRLPALLVTMTSTLLLRGIALWASDGISVELSPDIRGLNVVAPVVALLLSVGIALLLLWKTGGFSKKTKPFYWEMKYFWIYGLLAVIGVLAGWTATVCFGVGDGLVGSGSSNEMVILFVFAMISASTVLKNNWLALPWVLVLAMLWTVHDQAMILLELSPYSMIVSNASWVFIMLAVMSIAKRSWRKPI